MCNTTSLALGYFRSCVCERLGSVGRIRKDQKAGAADAARSANTMDAHASDNETAGAQQLTSRSKHCPPLRWRRTRVACRARNRPRCVRSCSRLNYPSVRSRPAEQASVVGHWGRARGGGLHRRRRARAQLEGLHVAERGDGQGRCLTAVPWK